MQLEATLRNMREECPHLETISLPKCDLEDRHVGRLVTYIAFSSDLRELDLSCNLLTADGMIKLAKAIGINSSLRVVKLWGNPVCPYRRAEVDTHFRNALCSGVQRPLGSYWELYTLGTNDIPRLFNQ